MSVRINRKGRKVVGIADKDPHFYVACLCLECLSKWVGLMHYQASIFELECTNCGAQNSFASFLPEELIFDLSGEK